MNKAAFEIKGWCPGALRPMQSGDGLIVRVRPQAGALTRTTFVALAEAASRFGNAQIDLTRRANVQIRGVSEASLSALHEVIGELGLLDESADGEAVRNFMIGPLAGIDPTEAYDVRGIAAELARLLASDPSLWALPTKFGFILDGGGLVTLARERADIRLQAMRGDTGAVVAIGIDTKNGVEWLGAVAPDAAAAAALTTARTFLDVTSRGSQQRMRELSAQNLASLRAAMKSQLTPMTVFPGKPEATLSRRIGLIDLGAGRFAVGIAAPFGRVETAPCLQFAAALSELGVTEIRLSPWRALYVEAADRQMGEAILKAAVKAGFIVDSTDPLLRIEACPGAPACASTSLDTRGDGRRLADILARAHFTGSAHVSGCAKGCAKSDAADLVLVGMDGRYGVVHRGTAQDRPLRTSSFAELAADPSLLLKPAGAAKP
jgi:precorrin-3B synthase